MMKSIIQILGYLVCFNAQAQTIIAVDSCFTSKVTCFKMDSVLFNLTKNNEEVYSGAIYKNQNINVLMQGITLKIVADKVFLQYRKLNLCLDTFKQKLLKYDNLLITQKDQYSYIRIYFDTSMVFNVSIELNYISLSINTKKESNTISSFDISKLKNLKNRNSKYEKNNMFQFERYTDRVYYDSLGKPKEILPELHNYATINYKLNKLELRDKTNLVKYKKGKRSRVKKQKFYFFENDNVIYTIID